MTIDRIGILASKAATWNGRGKARGRGKKFIDSGDALHPSGNMCKRDQRVRLTAAIVRIQRKIDATWSFFPPRRKHTFDNRLRRPRVGWVVEKKIAGSWYDLGAVPFNTCARSAA